VKSRKLKIGSGQIYVYGQTRWAWDKGGKRVDGVVISIKIH